MPYCPVCHCEYNSRIIKCPDCDAELVDELEPAAKSNQSDGTMVCIYVANNPVEAEIIKGVLQDAGIGVWHRSESVKIINIFTSIGSAPSELYVLESRADDALAIIKAYQESDANC